MIGHIGDGKGKGLAAASPFLILSPYYQDIKVGDKSRQLSWLVSGVL